MLFFEKQAQIPSLIQQSQKRLLLRNTNRWRPFVNAQRSGKRKIIECVVFKKKRADSSYWKKLEASDQFAQNAKNNPYSSPVTRSDELISLTDTMKV